VYAFDRLSTSQINSEPKWSCFHYVSETLLFLKAHPINDKSEERDFAPAEKSWMELKQISEPLSSKTV
jgi:hypothetical protein